MRALSVQQPFAELIVRGLKILETRTWPTDYRGPLLIHAARRSTLPASLVDSGNAILERNDIDPATLAGGAIIGQVTLAGCYSFRDFLNRIEVARLLTDDEERIGLFGRGWFRWHLTNPVAFATPICCIGSTGLWEPSSELRRKVAVAIRSVGEVSVERFGSAADRPYWP
jgi:hypothetical protein